MTAGTDDPWHLPMGWCADVPAFRLVAPKATYVEIVFRDHPAGTRQETRSMTATSVGERAFWHWRGTPPLPCYRYRVHLVDRTLNLADPWSATVARQKGPRGDAWSVALQEPAPFDWQGCEAVEVPAPSTTTNCLSVQIPIRAAELR